MTSAVAPAEPSSESELRTRLAELADAVQARDDFLAVAVHELRNPMHALSLQLSAIQRLAGAGNHAEIFRLVDSASRAISSYLRRANGRLDVSRINAGVLRLEYETVDLAELLRDAIEFQRAEAEFHRVSLQPRFPQSLCGRWDRRALEQVVDNLIVNAIKYGAGHPVRIDAALRDADTVELAVHDQGRGMSPADQARVFGKFERVVGGRRAGAGFGLGLWIVRRLVEAHGGSIRIDSALGRGSSFIVHLPIEPTQTSSDDDGA